MTAQYNVTTNKKFEDWSDWLDHTENDLKKRGYRRSVNKDMSNCDFMYTKDIDEKYLSIVMFYDFRKYNHTDKYSYRIGVQYLCLLHNCDGRIDLSVSKDITLTEFENMSEDFYITYGNCVIENTKE